MVTNKRKNMAFLFFALLSITLSLMATQVACREFEEIAEITHYRR